MNRGAPWLTSQEKNLDVKAGRSFIPDRYLSSGPTLTCSSPWNCLQPLPSLSALKRGLSLNHVTPLLSFFCAPCRTCVFFCSSACGLLVLTDKQTWLGKPAFLICIQSALSIPWQAVEWLPKEGACLNMHINRQDPVSSSSSPSSSSSSSFLH